jgi:hypothetical protein
MGATRKLKPGAVYDGPKSIQTIDGVTAHYADIPSGPVRLVDQDGSFRVATADDPVQEDLNIVELEVDEIHGQTSTEA